MQQILDKLKIVRDHNSKDQDLNETSFNPWTQQQETLAETLVDIRKKELEHRKLQLEVELIDINRQLEIINNLKTWSLHCLLVFGPQSRGLFCFR